MNTFSIEPELQTFEAVFGCKICIHILSGAFSGKFDPQRRSHRVTFPCHCGKEVRSYCVQHCLHEINQRITAEPQRDIFLSHCRNHFVELVAPVHRNGQCVLVLFAGLLDVGQKKHVRRIARMLPIFAAGLEAKVHSLRLVNTTPQDTFVEKVSGFIADNYHKAVSSADAARVLNISHSRFCHLLKEKNMENFSVLLLHERLFRAKQLMIFNEEIRLNEVALLCGFQSYEHFCRSFRNDTGISPSNYRKKHKVL